MFNLLIYQGWVDNINGPSGLYIAVSCLAWPACDHWIQVMSNCNARGRRVYTHTARGCNHDTIHHLHVPCSSNYQPLCSAVLILDYMTPKSGMEAQIGLETAIEPQDLVYYLSTIFRTCVSGKSQAAKPLLLLFSSWVVALLKIHFHSLQIYGGSSVHTKMQDIICKNCPLFHENPDSSTYLCHYFHAQMFNN